MPVVFRNPAFNHLGTIDVEVEHSAYGWMPYTASADDISEEGRELYQAIVTAGGIAPYVPPEPRAKPVPEEISRRQFC